MLGRHLTWNANGKSNGSIANYGVHVVVFKSERFSRDFKTHCFAGHRRHKRIRSVTFSRNCAVYKSTFTDVRLSLNRSNFPHVINLKLPTNNSRKCSLKSNAP